MLEFKFENILRISILVGIFAVLMITPFLVSSFMFFPYITGKTFFFWIVVEVMLAGWVILAIIDSRYRPRMNLVFGAFVLFMLVMALANLMGVDPANSLGSNFERMEGYLNLLHLFAFFVISISVIRDRKTWFYLLEASVATSVVVCGFAFWEYFIDNPGRVSAPLGNPIYLAGYLLFNLFLAMMFFLQRLQRKSKIAIVYGVIILLQGVVIILTETRGTMLGILIGGFVVALGIAIFEKQNNILRWMAIVAVTLSFVAGSFLGFVVYINNSPEMLNSSSVVSFNERVSAWPVVDRFSQISLVDGGEGARITLWQIALDGVKERPVLGWGQENFRYIFDEKYNPVLFDREFWFDRVHNMPLEWLVAGGILGLLSYLALLFFIVFSFWKTSELILSRYDKIVLSSLILAYLVHSIFVFDVLVSYILFVTLAGFSSVMLLLSKDSRHHSVRVIKDPKVLAVLGFIILTLLSFTIYFVNIKPMNAGTAILKGGLAFNCAQSLMYELPWGEETEQSVRASQGSVCRQFLPDDLRSFRTVKGAVYSPQEIARHSLVQSIENFELAVENGNLIGRSEAQERFSQTARQVIKNTDFDIETRQLFYERARKSFVNYLEEIEPELARPYLFFGLLDHDAGNYESAVDLINHALKYSPKKQQIIIQLASSHIELGEFEEALELSRKAHLLDQSFSEPIIRYALTARYLGDESKVEDILLALNRKEYIFREDLVRPWAERGDFQKMIDVREERIEILQNNFSEILKDDASENEINSILENILREYSLISQTYALMGRINEVEVVLDKMIEDFPGLEPYAEDILERSRQISNRNL